MADNGNIERRKHTESRRESRKRELAEAKMLNSSKRRNTGGASTPTPRKPTKPKGRRSVAAKASGKSNCQKLNSDKPTAQHNQVNGDDIVISRPKQKPLSERPTSERPESEGPVIQRPTDACPSVDGATGQDLDVNNERLRRLRSKLSGEDSYLVDLLLRKAGNEVPCTADGTGNEGRGATDYAELDDVDEKMPSEASDEEDNSDQDNVPSVPCEDWIDEPQVLQIQTSRTANEDTGSDGAPEEHIPDDNDDDVIDVMDGDNGDYDLNRENSSAGIGANGFRSSNLNPDVQTTRRIQTQTISMGSVDTGVGRNGEVGRPNSGRNGEAYLGTVGRTVGDETGHIPSVNRTRGAGMDSNNTSRNEVTQRPTREFGRDRDDSVLLNAIRATKTDIVTSVKAELRSVMNEMKRDKDTIKHLDEEIKGLSELVSIMANILFHRQLSSGNGKHRKEVDRALSTLPAYFNERLMSAVLTKCFICHCRGLMKEARQSQFAGEGHMGNLFLSIMNFAIQPSDTKRLKFESLVGRRYCVFRHGVLMSAVLALQQNSFGTFLSEREQVVVSTLTSENVAEGASTDHDRKSILLAQKAKQPRWLKTGFITASHCEDAAIKLESRRKDEPSSQRTSVQNANSSTTTTTTNVSEEQEQRGQRVTQSGSKRGKSKKGTKTLRNVIATEATEQVYKIITSHLHKARDCYKLQLFHDLSYVFIGWSEHQKVIDQGSLRLNWMQDESEYADYSRNIPLMETVRMQDRYNEESMETEDIHIANMKKITNFIDEHPEMTLVITHDVVVDGSIRKLRYFTSVIEVVCRFIGAFCSLDSNSQAKEILSVHSEGFHVLVSISRTIRDIIDQTIRDVNPDKSVKWSGCVSVKKRGGKGSKATAPTPPEDACTNTYKYPSVNGLSMEIFLPPPSKRKDALESMLLTLKQGEFERKHRSNDSDKVTTGDSTEVEPDRCLADGVPIFVDERQGVYEI